MEQTISIIKGFLDFKRFSCNSEETLKFYDGYLRRFFKFTGISPYDLGDTKSFRSAYMNIFNRQISVETKIKYLKIIRHFSDYLMDEGIISSNPARKHPTPRKIQRTIRETFHKNEITEILHYLDDYYYRPDMQYLNQYGIYDRNRLIIFLFLYTGIRRSELVNLRVDQIYQDVIFIKQGKGSKDRIVSIPPFISEMIREYIHRFRPSLYLFTGRRIDKLSPQSINRIFQKISENTGIDVYAHKFRHTYATNCISQNIPLNVLQSQLGHTSINTTAIYIHSDRTVINREISKLQNDYYFC